MNRPLLIRLAPLRWRTALYHRIYRSQRERWKALYSGASLHFAPGVRLDLWPSDEGHSNIAFTGFYELDFSEQVVRLAAAGGLIVDVGANYGYFSLLWASVSRDNRVIAFEASPRNHEALRRNVARNNLESQITVRQVALGRDSGTMPFSLGISEQTGWGGLALDRSVDTVEVPVLTLDETLAGAGMVDLLKVDVEGADTWVLLGAKRLLEARRIRQIYFEQNKERMELLGIGKEEASEFLRAVGYKVEPLDDPESAIVQYYAAPAS